MRFLINEKLSEHRYKTPEGYLVCTDAILARTGPQTYRHNEIFTDSDDNSEIEVNRTEDEVFSPATLASFENKPLTLEHPDEDVTIHNHSQYAVGFVRDIRRGEFQGTPVILGNIVVTDEETVKEIENGEYQELSCGYDCDIVGDGQLQQTNIRGNHVALCECGRAGIAKLQDSKCEDMALSRADAMDRCIHLGKKFIEHFDKIYNNKNDTAVNHWRSEMNSWYKAVLSIKLKSTNDCILDGELRDWFFTAGANPEDFMKNPTTEEIKEYDRFVTRCINTKQLRFEDSSEEDKKYVVYADGTWDKYVALFAKRNEAPRYSTEAVADKFTEEEANNLIKRKGKYTWLKKKVKDGEDMKDSQEIKDYSFSYKWFLSDITKNKNNPAELQKIIKEIQENDETYPQEKTILIGKAREYLGLSKGYNRIDKNYKLKGTGRDSEENLEKIPKIIRVLNLLK